MPNTEHVDPSLVKDRIEKLLPRLAASRTLVDEPNRVTPTTDSALPRRENDLVENALPK